VTCLTHKKYLKGLGWKNKIMMLSDINQTYTRLKKEIEDLKSLLDEANETIDAIRTGQIDALVVKNDKGHQVYTLKSADQTYRLFIEKMNEGAVTINENGLILYCNSRFSKMVGLPLSKVVGQVFVNFVQPFQKDWFNGIIKSAWKNAVKGELYLLNNKNQLAPFLFSLTTLELDEGTALSIILTDLTMQKDAERNLKLKNIELEETRKITQKLNEELEDKVKERTRELLISREHFKFLADNIPVIAWTAGPDGIVTYFNKRWYEFTGSEENEESFTNWLDIIHPDDRENTMVEWNRSLQTGMPYKVDYRFKKITDGTYVWHQGNALPYKNEANQVVAWFGISSNIDFQKKELQQKDDFISIVSHELKTPLTSLKGFTQLLMATTSHKENGSLGNYLEIMNNQINKLTRLIADLMDATHFNYGTLQFNEENFDFNDLVREIIAEMQHTTTKHTLQIQLDKTVAFYGDRNRIGQVIINLISNAIKYSPNSKEVIITSAIKNNQLIFCVQDFGVGISKEEQNKLYSRFFRADEEKSKTFPGMGLGLYISMKIIENYKGKMWVESHLGKGTKSYFSLYTIADK
jgi:two-component system, OmpR family, phosphate regulon sensor histidine kinase PhoR